MSTPDILYGTCDVRREFLALADSGKLPAHVAGDFDSQHCDGSHDYPVYPMRRNGVLLGPAGIAALVAVVTDRARSHLMTAPIDLCIRCIATPATGICCTAHGKKLCHNCYRRTHFVEVCVAGCSECAAEGLPVNLNEGGSREPAVV